MLSLYYEFSCGILRKSRWNIHVPPPNTLRLHIFFLFLVVGTPRILYRYVILPTQPTFTQIGSSYDPQKVNNSVV